jgi:hypothetical protein
MTWLLSLEVLKTKSVKAQIDSSPHVTGTLPPQAAAVFTALLLNEGREVPIDVFTALLNVGGTRNPRQTVHNAINAIRRSLGEKAFNSRINSVGDAYVLNLRPDDYLDLREFRRHLHAASDSDLEPAAACRELERALRLWSDNPGYRLDYAHVDDPAWISDEAYFAKHLADARQALTNRAVNCSQDELKRRVYASAVSWLEQDYVLASDVDFYGELLELACQVGDIDFARSLPARYATETGKSDRTLITRLHASSGRVSALVQAEAPARRTSVDATLRATRSDMLNHKLPGSQRIQLRHLIEHASLWVTPRGVVDPTKEPIEDVLQYCLDMAAPSSPSAHKVLLIGSGGMGKSSLSMLLHVRATDARLKSSQSRLPVHLDLRNYRSDTATYLSEPEWLQQRLAESYGAEFAAEATRDRTRTFLVLDSLDEFLAGKSHTDVQRVLDSQVVKDAALICCRSQAYFQYLQGTDLVASREVVELSAWSASDRASYVTAFYEVFFRDNGGDRAAKALNAVLRNSERRLGSVCSSPVRLNMTLELFEPGDNLSFDLALTRLYDEYLDRLLSIEAARAGSVFNATEKQDLLTKLAWLYYDEGSLEEEEPLPFSEQEVLAFLREEFPRDNDPELGAKLDDLRTRTILATGHEGARRSRKQMHFAHKSFQEYLVAQYAMQAMLSSGEATLSAVLKHFSPEVGEFLKGSLCEYRRSKRMSQIVLDNCTEALTRLKGRVTNDHDDARSRIGRQQLFYYLGSLSLPEARSVLREALSTEGDPWVRRGIIIGLTFGGADDALDQYLDELGAERGQPGDHPLNDVNTGAQLSYFGDQPFDFMRPEVDLRGGNRGRTVDTMLYQLTTETERGCWRIDLYTLCDLWEHRPFARASYESAMTENLSRARHVAAALQADETASKWPELAKFLAIVDEISRSAGGAAA